MFLSDKEVAATVRYVKNGPVERNASFNHKMAAGRIELGGGILRYSTTTPEPVQPTR